jgi:hypothetical protein
MDQLRVAPERLGTGFGASEEGSLPVGRNGETRVEGTPARKRSVIGIAARIVRNAAIAVAFMTLVPVAIVGLNGKKVWSRISYSANIPVRSAFNEAMRPLTVPKDPSITPMQAGRAFNALHPPADRPSPFVAIEPARRPARPWTAMEISPEMFTGARSNIYKGPPNERILEIAPKGLTPREVEYLRAIGTAEVWHEFDLIGRANAVDMVGGRFQVPFGADATWPEMPIAKMSATKELAYASMSRAAWHMSLGKKDSAEC